jgi:hypothetical protein
MASIIRCVTTEVIKSGVADGGSGEGTADLGAFSRFSLFTLALAFYVIDLTSLQVAAILQTELFHR